MNANECRRIGKLHVVDGLDLQAHRCTMKGEFTAIIEQAPWSFGWFCADQGGHCG
jgi:hypothetical protein